MVGLVAGLERLVMHAQLVAPLHIQQNQMEQEPESEEEGEASKDGTASSLVVPSAIHSQLYGLSESVERC